MGGRRLPREKVAAAGAALVLVLLLAGCGSSGSAASDPSASAPTPTASATPVAPTPSPTRDPLAEIPADAQAARSGVEAELRATADPCPPRLRSLWKAHCAAGDVDGDGKSDDVYLVPLRAPTGTSSFPGVAFVRRSTGTSLELLRFDGDTDVSRIGQEFFASADRTGDGKRLEISLLSAACTASGCSYQAHVLSWDGTAWRELGPIEALNNLDRIAFADDHGKPTLVMHAGAQTAPGAGPTRATTVTYGYDGHRFADRSEQREPPVYFFSAIQDADMRFDAGDFAGAVTLYRAALANKDLKDWQQEERGTPGRPALEAYGLLRIAVAMAATGADPSAALDAVIREGKDDLFVYAAEKFRNGFLERGTVTAGCAAVTAYLSITSESADNPGHLRDVFNYGYANLPARKPKDVCPL